MMILITEDNNMNLQEELQSVIETTNPYHQKDDYRDIEYKFPIGTEKGVVDKFIKALEGIAEYSDMAINDTDHEFPVLRLFDFHVEGHEALNDLIKEFKLL